MTGLHASNTIIEIDSSPEPPMNPLADLPPRRTPTPTRTAAKGKGKPGVMEMPKILGPVIELTDSDSDLEGCPTPAVPPPSSSRAKPASQPQPGPSGLHPSQKRARELAHNDRRARGGTAQPVASGSSKKRKRDAPLFLPGLSDEDEGRGGGTLNDNDGAQNNGIRARARSAAPPIASGSGTGDATSLEQRKVVTPPVLASDEDESEWIEKPFPVFESLPTPVRPKVANLPPGMFPPTPVAPPALPVPAPGGHPHPPAVARPAAPNLPTLVHAPPPRVPPVIPPPHQQVQPPPQPDSRPLTPIATIIVPDPEPDPDPAVAEPNPVSAAIAQILEIVPDVEPDYLLTLIHTHIPDFAAQTAEHVLGLLFEDKNYPRAKKQVKGKERAVEEERGQEEGRLNKKPKVDYGNVDRPFIATGIYSELALYHLQCDFPFIPKPYLRQAFSRFKRHYAATHLALAAAEATYDAQPPQAHRPYNKKVTRYNGAREGAQLRGYKDEEFTEERRWLEQQLGVGEGVAAAECGGKGKGKEKAVNDDAAEEDVPLEEGTGIECQCCFSEYAFDKMVQCPEAHLFCSSCVSQYASTQLGAHSTAILCMHDSGCAQPFPPSELRRVLSAKLMELFERVVQQKEVESAGLEGLEECPFCEWKCVMEVGPEEEKLFRCGNEEGGCGEVSCRACKKKDHLPKSCKEVEEDRHLDGRHAIEEAMTRALMRNCPKCQKAFVKEQGCNKMTCPHCRTLSCYVCRQVITGYEHFNQTSMIIQATTSSTATQKCLLWDKVEDRHAAEVKAAAEKAMEDYKRENPDVDEKEIKVDIPVAPPPAPVPALNQFGMIMPVGAPVYPHVAQIPGVQLYPHYYAGHVQANPGAANAAMAAAYQQQLAVAEARRQNLMRDQHIAAQAEKRERTRAQRAIRRQVVQAEQLRIQQQHQQVAQANAVQQELQRQAVQAEYLPLHQQHRQMAEANAVQQELWRQQFALREGERMELVARQLDLDRQALAEMDRQQRQQQFGPHVVAVKAEADWQIPIGHAMGPPPPYLGTNAVAGPANPRAQPAARPGKRARR